MRRQFVSEWLAVYWLCGGITVALGYHVRYLGPQWRVVWGWVSPYLGF